MFRFSFKSLLRVAGIGYLLLMDPVSAAPRKLFEPESNDLSDQLKLLNAPKIFPYAKFYSIKESESLRLKKEGVARLLSGKPSDPKLQLIRNAKAAIAVFNQSLALNADDVETPKLIDQTKEFIGTLYFELYFKTEKIKQKKKALHKSVSYFEFLNSSHKPEKIKIFKKRGGVLGSWGIDYYHSALRAESAKDVADLSKLAMDELSLSLHDFDEILKQNADETTLRSKVVSKYYLAACHFNLAAKNKDSIGLDYFKTAESIFSEVLEDIKRVTVADNTDFQMFVYRGLANYFLGAINEAYANSFLMDRRQYAVLRNDYYYKAYLDLEIVESSQELTAEMREDIRIKKEKCSQFVSPNGFRFNSSLPFYGLVTGVVLCGVKKGTESFNVLKKMIAESKEEHIEPEVDQPRRKKKFKSSDAKQPPKLVYYHSKKKRVPTYKKPKADQTLQASNKEHSNDSGMVVLVFAPEFGVETYIDVKSDKTAKHVWLQSSKHKRDQAKDKRTEHREQKLQAARKLVAEDSIDESDGEDEKYNPLDEQPKPEIYPKVGARTAEIRAGKKAIQKEILSSHLFDKTAKEAARLEKVTIIKNHLDAMNRKFSQLGKTAAPKNDTKTNVDVKTYDRHRIHSAEVLELKRKEGGFAKKTTNSTTQIGKQMVLPVALSINQSDLKDSSVVERIPDLFLDVAKEICGYQEVTNKKFFVTGGTARKFIFKLLDPTIETVIDDLDILTNADFKQVGKLFDPVLGYEQHHQKKTHKLDCSIVVNKNKKISFCHRSDHAENSVMDLKIDAANADNTISALYIEFTRTDQGIRATIHDPTGVGLKHLLNKPPIIKFFGDIKTKLLNDPIQIFRAAYQKVTLNGMIPDEDMQLVKALLKEHSDLLNKIEPQLNWFLTHKITQQDPRRVRILKTLQQMEVLDHLSKDFRRKQKLFFVAPPMNNATAQQPAIPPEARSHRA